MKLNSEEYLTELDNSIKELGRRGFQQEITDGFVAGGHLCYHTHDSRNSPKGFPDTQVPMRFVSGQVTFGYDDPWSGVGAGDFVLIVIEAKVGKNKPTLEQIAWLEALAACGAMTFVLWPRHRPILNDLYGGHMSRRVGERIGIYDKYGEKHVVSWSGDV